MSSSTWFARHMMLCVDYETTMAKTHVIVILHISSRSNLFLLLLFLLQVETIGDAYMVVGGLPTFTPNHADRIVSMAFGMIKISQRVLSPVDQKPIEVSTRMLFRQCCEPGESFIRGTQTVREAFQLSNFMD